MKGNLKLVILLLCMFLAVFYSYSVRPDDFSTIETLKFPTGEGATDIEKTLSSLTKVQGAENMYMMTYYGDYQEQLEKDSKLLIDLKTGRVKPKCSLISLTADKNNPMFGRNFDFANSGIIITRYQPPNKYESIAFTPSTTIFLPKDFDPERLSMEVKQNALHTAFLSTCGMNEKGLVVALASTASVPTKEEKGLKFVYKTLWLRELLDNAKDVEEAVEITKTLRAFDELNDIQHHMLVADAKGNSVAIEFAKGDWRFFYEENPWQVVTNSALYNRTHEEKEKMCWRYKKASKILEELGGRGDWQDTMRTLKAVTQGQPIDNSSTGTLFSFAADISNRTIYLCTHSEYDKVYKFGFE
ncbi:MAG: linear amide C-N hydrolase [Epulopiscium sp.]|nr:linear amide C-N hydrolase [Candidatus Epulonipiscium sp.]